MQIDERLYQRKSELLDYYRQRADESLSTIKEKYGTSQHKERATAINKAIQGSRRLLLDSLRQEAERSKWTRDSVLNNVLMLSHCCNVAMLDFRNSVWAYDYMAFSRRIGELWEPFCSLAFQYPTRTDIKLFVPPTFAEVRTLLGQEITAYINTLKITPKQKAELNRYYDKVWTLVQSGEIQLQLDLHFGIGDERFVVDFKSGFGSNEKGNTNRLLLVGTIYKNIATHKYRCLILVRSDAEQNNHYFKTLAKSGVWEGACGQDAYDQIHEYSGFDLKKWIDTYIAWEQDLLPETIGSFQKLDLMKYLKW